MPSNHFVFVYNADSGFFNTLSDIAHKITSPETYQCKLCALTHGHFKMRSQWHQFLDHTDSNCIFYHRDEAVEKYVLQDCQLPAIFIENNGDLHEVVSKQTIDALQDVDALIDLVKNL